MPKWICILLIFVLACHAQEVIYYVSPQGNNSWSGKIAVPNKDHSDGPFRTPEWALAAIEKEKSEKIIVYFRQGIYALDSTISFQPDHSGTADRPVIWSAFANEHPVFTGAKALNGHKRSTRPFFNSKGKNHIIEYDLEKLGIVEYGGIEPRGAPPLQLFFNGRRMTMARYPNEGWLRVADVPQQGDSLFHEGLEREKRYDGVPVGRHYGRIVYSGNRPNKWHSPQQAYVHGYWTWDWSDSYQKIERIDTLKKEITLASPHHHYGYTKNQRYYFLNIIEELDTPGEWVLDRKERKMYFWPPADPDSAVIYVSTLSHPMMRINASYISIRGLKFSSSRGEGVVIEGGNYNEIAGCTFQHLGKQAVVINGGNHNGVSSCNISNMSLGGIVLKGGNRPTLQRGENYAVNNHIHHFSQWIRTWQLAIDLYGVGNRIAHNLIHDGPHEAIYVRGNDHLVEFNEIHSVCQETGDAGAIHTGRDYTWRGNVYRYNYIHHLQGQGLHGVTALYLDDFSSGYTLYGNICYRSGRGTLIGGGRDNVIQNNLFIDCHPSILLDARGLSWAFYYFDGTYNVLWERMAAMNATQPPFSRRYPELLTLKEDNPAVPKNNRILNNVSTGGRWIELYDYYAFEPDVYTIKNNLIADAEILKRIQSPPNGWEPYYLDLNSTEGYIVFDNNDTPANDLLPGNMITDNAGLKETENKRFTLKPTSPAFELGFKAIPVDSIGLISDRYRKLPADNNNATMQ
ncbi:hypothetical protein GF407_03940 [candidate division KSB1 bacterium]|nr:hypothetical protein [candidate division KSB1 bacterium]